MNYHFMYALIITPYQDDVAMSYNYNCRFAQVCIYLSWKGLTVGYNKKGVKQLPFSKKCLQVGMGCRLKLVDHV